MKASALFVTSWAGAAWLRRGTAASRHLMWTLGVVGALIVPIAAWFLPAAAATTIAPTTAHVTAGLPTITDAGPAPVAAVPWLAIAWALGTFVVAVRIARSHLSARRLLRSSTAIDNELRRSDAIRSPMTIGILQPRVLLPASADTWPVDRLRAVLLHERGHIERRDTLVQLVAQLATAVYWWNPLAWLAAARLRIEREHACDDLVIAAGVKPSTYAADLLEVARAVSRERHAAICMVDASWTESRLRRILAPVSQPLHARLAIATLVVATAGGVVACSSARASEARPRITIAPAIDRGFTLRTDLPANDVDLSGVAGEIRHNLGPLEQCYEQRLAQKPTLGGTITIHWAIDASGNVPDACITDDGVGDAELVKCLNQVVLATHFTAPPHPVDVAMPFVFAAR